MTLTISSRLALRFAGLLVLSIGLSHFFMPGFGYDRQDLLAVPEQQRAHFVFLGTYAIGLFLVCFAILTLVAGKTRPTVQMTVFLGLMTLVWGARFGLEMVYPVNLPLFFLDNPHPVLAATILLIWLAYGVGFIASVQALVRPRGAGSGTG